VSRKTGFFWIHVFLLGLFAEGNVWILSDTFQDYKRYTQKFLPFIFAD